MPERARMEFLCCLARHPVLGGFGGRPSITHEMKFTLSPIEPVQGRIRGVIHPGYINTAIGWGPGGVPSVRRANPVRRIPQGPLPNPVQLARPTDLGFSYRRGRDLAETVRAKNSKANAAKADKS